MSARPVIPDHELRRPIGRGAYGEVWLARNVMGAARAVKIIWRRQFESERPYEREFAGIQRYEPVSRMTDGLVQVLHVGRNDAEGYFYYVMELADAVGVATGASPCGAGVKDSEAPETSPSHQDSEVPSSLSGGAPAAAPGPEPSQAGYEPRTLRSDLRRYDRLPVADCLRLALDVVGGLARLHEHGLVHRDVKPGNIIFVNGRAKLADIGLVSVYAEKGTFVGTEGYIPPEGPGSPGADLFALGMVLYEAASGFPPDRFPTVPPEWFAEEAGKEALEFHEIVLKACEGAKERRYQSAEQMQADLALLQSGQSVRRVRALERRVARSRRVGLAAAGAVGLALLGVLVANYRARVEADRRANETRLRQQAETAREQARQQLYKALLEQARATVRSVELGQRVRALDAIRRAAAISNSVELRREATAALALPDLRLEREWPTGRDVSLVELDPAFESIALCRGSGPVEIRSLSDYRLLTSLPASTNLSAYRGSWSPDRRFFAVRRDHPPNGERADLEVWEVTNARRMFLLRDVPWGAMSIHPRLPRMATGRSGGGVTVWDLENGQEVARLQLAGVPTRLQFAPDGERFAALYASGAGWVVSVHRADDGATQASHLFANYVISLHWHPSGRWVSVPDFGGTVQLMDSQTGEVRALGRHKAEAVLTVFSPDGDYLISGGWERELICWDLRTMQRAFTIGLKSFVAQFRADGQELAVVTQAGVQLHAFELPAAQREFAEDLGVAVRHAAFSPDSRWLAASGQQRLGVWDWAGRSSGALADEGAKARLYFTPDGDELFGSRDEGCFRWRITPASNAVTHPRLERLALSKPEGFTSLCLASNSIVFTGSRGSQLVDRDDLGAGQDRWARTSEGLNRVSPDGRWLAIYRPFTPFLYLYRLPGLERVAKLTNRVHIASIGFSPGAGELAVASNQGVEFWSTKTWERTRELTNFTGIVLAPDARAWWLTKDFSTAGLYDAHTLEPLLLLPTGMLPLALNPDGRKLAVSVDARRLQVWDLDELRERLRELGLDWAG